MSVNSIVSVWAAVGLAGVIALVVAARRIGRYRSAAWLVVLGLVVLTLEEPALTLWLAVNGRQGDRDAMAGSVTAMARTHVLDAGVYGVAAAVLLGWIAMTAFKRGQPWARRVLGWGLVVAAATEVATTLLVFSRGLPLPGAAGVTGRTGFGWQPLAVGLLAWAAGLWLARAGRYTQPAAPVTSLDGAP